MFDLIRGIIFCALKQIIRHLKAEQIMFWAILIVCIFPSHILSCGAVIDLKRLLARRGSEGVSPTMNLMVSMHDSVRTAIQRITETEYATKDEAATALTNALRTHSTMSQGPVMAALKSYGLETESYWITNQILVKGASPPVIQTLMSTSGVKDIVEEITFPILPVFNVTLGIPPKGPEWNVRMIQADKIWNKTKGEGILVAGIDTGVRHTHTSLKDNYVGRDKFGWYDPIFFTQEPNDLHGHGTHTLGTAVGTNGVGVAPGAKWMACRGCLVGNCLQHAIISCGQYILCPNNPTRNSNTKKCTNVPDLVNNSWGGPSTQKWFNDIISAWRAAGIIPFFAIGNSGPKCETTGSPGNHPNVIGVGSTDSDDRLSKFSSRGPAMKVEPIATTGTTYFDLKDVLNFVGSAGKIKTKTYLIKPDICAPGHGINSANILSDSSYKVQSGSSMAAPAATGAAALLLSINRKLKYDALLELLTTTAVQKVSSSEAEPCGGIPPAKLPNNLFGNGRIDVLKAYNKLVQDMKKSKSI